MCRDGQSRYIYISDIDLIPGNYLSTITSSMLHLPLKNVKIFPSLGLGLEGIYKTKVVHFATHAANMS